MIEDMQNKPPMQDRIIKKEDIETLFNLEDDDDFSIELHEKLITKYEKNAGNLNPIELNLFLVMHLENAGQADSILSFLQEQFPQYSNKVVNSLRLIGAIKSANIISQAIEILPKDGSWFFDKANETEQKLMEKLDMEFSDYPDGNMNDLYRKYANKFRGKILND